MSAHGLAGGLRDQLAWAGRTVVAAGLVVGSGGNLSARVPGADACWVTGAGTWLDALRREDFARVGIGATGPAPVTTDAPAPGPPVEPDPAGGPVPSTELPLHLATYRARPDVGAIVHLHPQAAILLDAMDLPIRLITTDHAFYLRRIARTPFRRPGSRDLAELAAAAALDANCVLLAHHGCSVLADTVELAVKRALYLEEAARLTCQAIALSNGRPLPECPATFLDGIDADQHH
jgi:ribulose-5-phosphate 4-epimerase/fuculose-1-phosphate aldolase